MQMQADFDTLVSELTRRYNPVEREAAWRVEFRNRMRQTSETAMQYGYALKRLALKAFPQMSLSAQEQWVMDQFCAGLGNIDLRRHVQFGHPKTLNDAISLAVEYEAFDSNCKDRIKKPTVRQGEVFQVQDTTGPEVGSGSSWDKGKIQCFYCKQLGHFKRECPKLQKMLEQQRAGQQSHGNNAQSN